MTTYGTIPTSSSASGDPSSSPSPLDFISRAKERGRSALSTRRPWREVSDIRSFSVPPSLGESYLRIRTNCAHFAANYAIVVLLVVFLSLLWIPVSLIVFIVMVAAWLLLYFLRDVPIVAFGYEIGDRIILVVLSVVTLVVLLLTGATLNILVSLAVGIVVVILHAVFRRTDNLQLDEESTGAAGWYTVVSGEQR